MKRIQQSLFEWLDRRYQLKDLVEFMRHKKVPIHHGSVWYYFGGVSLFLFIIQVTTGILLLLYYRPGEESSYESVRFIVSDVQFGWLFRSIHSWSANLMVLSLLIHLFSVFFARSYQYPRELTWITGLMLFGLTLAFGFSGYLLPWNELAFFATKVGTDIPGTIPVIGPYLVQLIRGGEDVTGATLSRFFGFHVAVLPGVFTFLLLLHLLFVQRQGMSEPQTGGSSPSRSMPFFPNFILRDVLLWLVALNILAVLSVHYPWELGTKADPFAPAPAGIKPEWYFLFMFQTLKILPAKVGPLDGEFLGVAVTGLAGTAALLLPFWDRYGQTGPQSPLMKLLGIIVLIFIITMTIWGYLG